jgi:PrtD family type I secretion system ABC transporter
MATRCLSCGHVEFCVLKNEEREILRLAMRGSLGAFAAIGLFSMVHNLLMLTSPIFMMQVYDRVLASGSIPSLVVLSGLVLVLLLVSGLLDLIRAHVLVRVALALDERMAHRLFDASTRYALRNGQFGSRALREFEILRSFIASPGPATLLDLPWTPLYLGLLFILHWLLGAVALASTLLLLIIAWLAESVTARGTPAVTDTARRAQDLGDAGHRNAGVMVAMGFEGHVRERWLAASRLATLVHSRMADRLMSLQSASKALRLVLQSAILATGAYLAIQGDISAGAIVAGSILLGRGLAPLEQAIGHWKGFSRARTAYTELERLFAAIPSGVQRTTLPTPAGQVDVSDLHATASGGDRFIFRGLRFSVAPGEVLAVIGPSAAGKSTLAKCLVGIHPWQAGEIRLDGARIDHWDPETLGQHIGYVPQESEFFAGTVRDNVCRFDPRATDIEVTDAAILARAHELILSLPSGYDTELGPEARELSAGQRQRIALARSLFRNPALVVLDEPNSNLDSIGDVALIEAITELKRRKRTVIIVSHRSSAIARADLVLAIDGGVQRAFGKRDEVVARLQQLFQPAQPQHGAPMAERPAPARSGRWQSHS